jgi:hypothetical protein
MSPRQFFMDVSVSVLMDAYPHGMQWYIIINSTTNSKMCARGRYAMYDMSGVKRWISRTLTAAT